MALGGGQSRRIRPHGNAVETIFCGIRGTQFHSDRIAVCKIAIEPESQLVQQVRSNCIVPGQRDGALVNAVVGGKVTVARDDRVVSPWRGLPACNEFALTSTEAIRGLQGMV